MRPVLAFFFVCMIAIPVAMAQELRSSLGIRFDPMQKLEADIEFQLCRAYYPESYSKKTGQVRLEYSLLKNLNVSGSYSYSALSHLSAVPDATGEETTDKQKFTADLVFKPKRFDNDLRIASRLRYQFSTTGDDRSKSYLRNKITFNYRISRSMEPYIALEPYYNLHSNSIRYFRLYLGNEFTLFSTKIDLYYIAEARIKKQNFGLQYIVGLAFKFSYEDHFKPLFSRSFSKQSG